MMQLPAWWPSKTPHQIRDCLEGMKEIPSSVVGLILTDPPYGTAGLKKFRGKEERTIANDANLDWLGDVATEFYRIMKDDTWCAVFGQWRTFTQFYEVFDMVGFGLKTVGIWDKGVLGMGAGLSEEYEMIYFFKKGEARETAHRGNVFHVTRPMQTPEHPNIKPDELFIELINLLSKKGDIVLDPYLGSGTTLLATRKTERIGLGFEIDKKYEETIKSRALIDNTSLEAWGL